MFVACYYVSLFYSENNLTCETEICSQDSLGAFSHLTSANSLTFTWQVYGIFLFIRLLFKIPVS